MSYDLLALISIFLVSALTLAIMYYRAQWKDARQRATNWRLKYRRIKAGGDIQQLAEAYDISTIRDQRRISRREIDTYAGPDEKILRETLHEMREHLIQRLIQEGALQVVRKDMPSKPYVELELFIRACKNNPSGMGEAYGDFMDRPKRPLGTR